MESDVATHARTLKREMQARSTANQKVQREIPSTMDSPATKERISARESETREASESKKSMLRNLRKRLNTELRIDTDDDFDSTAYNKRHWLHGDALSLRRPSGSLRTTKKKKPVTKKPLPDHLLGDDFKVPEFDCAKLPEAKKVGSGSQAHVYATHSHDGVKLAVKVLRAELVNEPIEFEAFQREVSVLARLAHPNVLSVVGAGIYEGFPCAVMEWCESNVSRELRLSEVDSGTSRIRKSVKSKWPARQRLDLCVQLSLALKFLHSGRALPRCFVMHRDLKPDNLGLADGGALKLLDFGLAICLSSDDSEAAEKGVANLKNMDTTFQRRTKAYDMVYDLTAETGTRRYMAPEIGRGEPYGLRSEVYSFAMVAWEMLNVSKPFTGFGPREMTERVWIRKERLTLPKQWHPDLRKLFFSMWHDLPMERPNFEVIHRALSDLYDKHPEHDPLGEHLEANGICC